MRVAFACAFVSAAACGQPDEPDEQDIDTVSQALVTITENFDSVPYCYSEACYSDGSSCTASFGQMISRSVAHPGDAQNLCITDAVYHGGYPGSSHTLSITAGASEALYTQNSASTRAQSASAIFRFEASLSGGTHLLVATHAKWYQSPGGPDNTYNYGYAVGAGFAQEQQHFFLEDVARGQILLSRPHTFTVGRWYKAQIYASGTGWLQLQAWEFVNGTWQEITAGSTTTRKPEWLSPSENGGGMLGAIVDSDHIDFDQFELTSY
jgi:hypothetical protein